MKMGLCMKLISLLAVFSIFLGKGWGNTDNNRKSVFSFKPLKSYYSDEIDSPYFFAGILDVCKNSKYIYVSDWKNSTVKIFDHTLKYISEFGKKGEGPGEITQIFTDLKCDENFIYLSTISNIHIFDSKGNFVKRISSNVIPINEIYILNRGFVFLGGGSNFAFYKTDIDFKITDKFYKMKKFNSFKCKQLFIFPNSFLTLSKKFLIFSPLKYNIIEYDLNKGIVTKSIKRDIEYKSVRCVKQKFNTKKYYILKGGYSYMLEDRNYYYYYYSNTDSSNRVDVYKKNFVLQRSGQYKENVYLKIAGYQGDNFLGFNEGESDTLVVFKLIEKIK